MDDLDAFLDAKPDDIDAFLDERGPVRDSVAQPSGVTPPSSSTYEVAGRYNTPGATPSYAPPDTTSDSGIDFGRALLTNEPTSGIGEDLIRGLPATVGGLAGGTIGLVAGAPLTVGAAATSAGGAALGGAAGESARQGIAQAYAGMTGRQFTPPGEVLKNVGIQGAAQGAGQAAGLGIGEVAKAARPLVNKLGAQVMRVGAGVPEKAGMAAMKNPSMLIDAPSAEAASEGYKAFERYTGLTGLNEQIKLTGKAASEADLEKHLFEVAARARNGVQSTPQELYHASQAASNLNLMGKLGNPRYAGLRAAISDAKSTVDDALEAIFPEYKNIRSDYAKSKAAGEFSSLLPLNKNTTPNVLRGVTAATTAGAGLAAGNPAMLAALPLVSPRFYGTALKGAALAGKVPATVYRVGVQAGAAGAGSALADQYSRMRPALP